MRKLLILVPISILMTVGCSNSGDVGGGPPIPPPPEGRADVKAATEKSGIPDSKKTDVMEAEKNGNAAAEAMRNAAKSQGGAPGGG